MKKLLLTLICVLVVALCLPTFALADTTTAQANDVHFIAPTGIALVGDYLLVSDSVADNQSAILCFDVANGNAHVFTHLLDKQATNLSSSNGRLFVIFADSFVEYAIADDNKSLVEVETFALAGAIDVCVGKLGTEGNLADTIYFLQSGANGDSLKYVKADKTAGTINGMTVATAHGCLAMSDGTNNYVYIAGKNADNTNSITRWGCVWGWDIEGDKLNANGVSYAGTFELLGLATNNREYPVVYGAKSMYNLNFDGNSAYVATQGFEDFSAQEYRFIKVTSNQNYFVILNDNNQINIFELVEKNGEPALSDNSSTIGSDLVKTAVPTTYTSFTLAKSTGYPTNIVYKTNDGDTSIESILTNNQVNEFIILGYSGYENASYYYVFVNGKFGWIKKSDDATTPDTDAKIEVVDTKVSDKVTYNAKFNSLGMVHIYNLPSSDKTVRKELEQVQQTASSMTSVKILQQFKETEKNIVWYYVEYGQGKYGFVKSSDVGQFTATLAEPVDAVVTKQVNASLFNAVTLHMTKDLDPETVLTYDGNSENLVKLYSGDWVNVIEVDEESGASFVQVLDPNGNDHIYGWVETARLADINAITTNAVVGFVALGIAIVLAIVFCTVFVSRKKKANK